MTAFDQAQQELLSEENARYDYYQEAYGATALDGYEEGFADYDGDLSFEDWKAEVKAAEKGSGAPIPDPVGAAEGDEIPF